MKANLILKNIGSHRGIREYKIDSGKITIFEGSNSSGKSTIIKSIATILSCPIKSNNLKLEANNFGILPMNNKESPIVNIFENEAKISLSYEDFDLNAILLKDGSINIEFPGNFQGNENFLYACMLLKNSKIQRYLASGDDNFQWIVSEMSYAGRYEEMNETNNSYTRLSNAAKNTLRDIDKKVGKYINEIKDLKNKKKKLEGELKEIQNEIKNLPPSDNPELKSLLTLKSESLNNISTSEKRLETFEKEKNDMKSKLEKITSNIDDLDIEIDNLEKSSESLRKQIEDIQKINPENESKKIKETQKVRDKIIEDLSEKKVMRELNNVILNARFESDTCPICGSKIPMNKERFSEELKKLNKEIKALTEQKVDIENDIKKSEKKIQKKEELPKKELFQLKKISQEIGIKKGKKNQDSKDIGRIPEELKTKEDSILREEKDLKNNQEELENVERKIDVIRSEDKENSELYQKEKELLNNISKIEVSIGKNKELIKENSQIELFGIKIPIERADNIINNLTNEFEKIELYLNEKITEQRTGAGKKFNSTIKDVIKDLKLEDFEDIYIDLEDYRLVVVRKGGKNQPLGALGGAERGIIGGILQISCKQTYLKEIPFFIGDDIILEFDPEMSETFINYLKTLAIEDDLFIIVTKISNSKQLKQMEI